MDKLITTRRLDFFGITDQGLVRSSNQDVWDCDPSLELFLVADGMGGHKAGEVAAQECVRFVLSYAKEHYNEKREDLLSFYKNALLKANEWVYEKSKKEKKYEGMGTTLSLLSFLGDKVLVGHVGDSRVYCMREKKLTLLTEDHTLAQELLTLGTLSQEESEITSLKNVLTRAIGTYASVEPTLALHDCKANDLYLICSDGLTNYVTAEQIKEILTKEDSLEERGSQLVTLANKHGGGDNITLVLVQVGTNNDLPR